MDTHDFSFAYRTMDYCRRNKRFDFTHAFVLAYPNYSRVIRDTHAAYYAKINIEAERNFDHPVTPNYSILWVSQVHDFVTILRRHVYLYGGSGLGKSTLANHIARAYDICILPGGDSAFEFSQLENDCELIISHDCSESYTTKHRETILKLCDGGLIAINPKCQAVKTIRFRGTLLLLSNFPPPTDPAFTRRFEVIYADEDGFQKKELPSSYISSQTYLPSSSSNAYESSCE